jgi:type II secretory pathway pseudopilin PulG
MTRLRSDSRGFSLVELIWAMALGMIILLAAFTIMERAFKANKEVSDREDALQRGRVALELMTRQLRSQVCLQTTTPSVPVVDGQDQTITFYTFLGDPTGTGSQLPEKHTLAYVPQVGTTPPKITETDQPVTQLSPTLTFGTATTKTLISNVTLPNNKLFTYYPGDATAGISSTALTTPLSTTDRARVVDIAVSFKVLPTKITDTANKQATTFSDSVFWRGINPEKPTDQPCDNS